MCPREDPAETAALEFTENSACHTGVLGVPFGSPFLGVWFQRHEEVTGIGRSQITSRACLSPRLCDASHLIQERSNVLTAVLKALYVLHPTPPQSLPPATSLTSHTHPLSPALLSLLWPRRPPGSSHSTRLPHGLCISYSRVMHGSLLQVFDQWFVFLFRRYEKQYSLFLRMLLTKIILFVSVHNTLN